MNKITQCTGYGLGECKRCKELTGWDRHWMSFLYEVDGVEGTYCYNCAKKLSEVKDD